ncbi:MAG: phosphatidate cytidylyltransferase [Zoogloeaceae bacterium]|jgi:phosphatidate cytidylyltransferase|nr:phosphatidate cytidylyltransferase [Zoogloeaceae bacterium]
MLKTRILTALVLLAVFVPAAIFLPDWAWGILISAVIGVAAWEWAGLAQFGKKGRLAYGIGLFACLVAFLLGIMDVDEDKAWSFIIGFYLVGNLFWFVVVPLWLYFRWSLKGAVGMVVGLLVFIPLWMLGLSYPPMKHIEGVNYFPRSFMLFWIGIAWIAGIAAYFAGRKFGRHQLAPSINPEKTWEGAAGAFAAILCVPYMLVIFWLLVGSNTLLEFIGFFIKILCSVAGLTAACILGDLFVSLLKRQANVTDSGTLLPGYGGVLDLFASTLALLAVWPIPFFFMFIGTMA